MTRLRPFVFLLFVFILLIQNYTAGKQSVLTDTVSLQKIDAPLLSLSKFKENNNFQYDRATAAPGLVQRLLMSLSEWLGFRYLARLSPLLVYLILFVAFILLIIVLFRSKFQGIFVKNPEENGLNITGSEIADHINFDELLTDAVRQKNYNLAVRYLYLILLRRLNQKQLIIYKPGKTNYEYLNEIKNKELIPNFRIATHNYEYAWYGQFHVDETLYQQIAGEYKRLTEKLND